MRIVLVALAVYVALKSAQFAFLGRAAGYRAEPVGLGRRLRAGEPILLIVAALITIPTALAVTSNHKRKFGVVLTHSVACYGLIQAYQRAPEIKSPNGEHAIYELAYGYRDTAFDASTQLSLDAGATQRRLDHAAATLFADSRRSDKGVDRSRLAETQRCLHPPELPSSA